MESPDQIRQEIEIRGDLPSCIGCKGLGRIGYECYLCGTDFADKVYERLLRIALYVEFGGNGFFQFTNVIIAYVPSVGARVYGYAFRAESLAVAGELNDIGNIAAPCVAYGRNLVYIYTKFSH